MDPSKHDDQASEQDTLLAEGLEQDLELQDEAAEDVRGGAASVSPGHVNLSDISITKQVDIASPR